MSTRIVHDRHFNARVHQTWSADVPDEMLADPLYFTPEGYSTPDFDAWMCDNGIQVNADSVEPLDDWELDFDSEEDNA